MKMQTKRQILAKWQSMYDAWSEGGAAAPSADDLVKVALDHDPSFPLTGDQVFDRLSAGAELADLL